jgi:4-aminobutyrate aminotransferase-like enzyme
LEQFDVDPDMVTMAKGLASSYMPLVGHVRGKGLFCGLELVKTRSPKSLLPKRKWVASWGWWRLKGS